jgi:hypothetical protein
MGVGKRNPHMWDCAGAHASMRVHVKMLFLS